MAISPLLSLMQCRNAAAKMLTELRKKTFSQRCTCVMDSIPLRSIDCSNTCAGSVCSVLLTGNYQTNRNPNVSCPHCISNRGFLTTYHGEIPEFPFACAHGVVAVKGSRAAGMQGLTSIFIDGMFVRQSMKGLDRLGPPYPTSSCVF